MLKQNLIQNTGLELIRFRCVQLHLEHEGEKDVVLALTLLQGGQISGKQGIWVNP